MWRFLVLCGVVGGLLVWNSQVGRVALLADMRGEWAAQELTDGAGGSPWRPVAAPGHYLWSQTTSPPWRVAFEKEFVPPDLCLEMACKFVAGEVGDTATVLLNGTYLRKPSAAAVGGRYGKNFPVGVDLPPALLRPAQANTLTIRVESFKADQAGLRQGPLGITDPFRGERYLHWKAFRTAYLPFACAVIVAVIASLIRLLPADGVAPGLWRLYDRYAVLSALFLLSFSELPRQHLALGVVIPVHFFCRFGVDYALFSLACALTQTPPPLAYVARAYQWLCGTIFAAMLALSLAPLAAFVPGSWDLVSFTYAIVRWLYLPTVLWPLCASAVHLGRACPPAAAAFALVWAVQVHDYLLATGRLQGEFFTKCSHLLALIVFSSYFLRAAAKAQATRCAEASAARQLQALVRQVDHDVRSPLTALDVASRQLGEVPENVRVLIRSAIGRVGDIVETLHLQAPAAAAAADDDALAPAARGPTWLMPHIGRIVAEQRMQRRRRPDVRLEAESSSSTYGLFVAMRPMILHRLLANLLDNAHEAIAGPGKVRVDVLPRGAGLDIVVSDSGAGVPDEVLARLGEVGVSRGKAAGRGLGLSHAVAMTAAAGGQLRLRRGRGPAGAPGTVARVHLPRSPPPRWFVPALELADVERILVVDDDPAVHTAWNDRLGRHGHAPVHCFALGEAEAQLAGHPGQRLLVLIDHEFVASPATGLDFIISHHLGRCAILVTSHDGDEGLLAACLRHQLRLVPKAMVGVLPISSVPVPAPRRQRSAVGQGALIGQTPGVCRTGQDSDAGRSDDVYKT